MAITTSHGVRLYYEEGGEGPPLLVISGTGADLRNRPSPLEWPLASSFRLVAYDQRGLGQSDQPAQPYTMAEYADDATAILDAVGLDQAHVLGVSFGGMVAQELAIRHPDRVNRLVLACTSSGGEGTPSYPLHDLAGLPEGERAERTMELSDIRWSKSWVAANAARAATIRDSFRRPPPSPGGLRQLEARRHHDTWNRLGEICAPTLVCAGRYDGIAPVANSEAIVSRIPGSQLRVFEGGHLFLAQDPQAFAAITDFLVAQ
ncbi:MAG: alpha/beta hydrolase [Acidimicrobiales bacterium]